MACCSTAVLGNAGAGGNISFTDLLTCADNIALPGFFIFLYVYLMFLYTESSFIFISH